MIQTPGHRLAPRLRRTAARFIIVALVSLLLIEAALQVAFPSLPPVVIEQMPQYLERIGFRLDTSHGAREYPAGQIVDYMVSRASGDLFRLTCLAPADAPPFEPYRVRFTRDAHGFRNEEPWPERVELAVIGDSFVAAESIVDPFWRDLSASTLVLGLPGSGAMEQQRLYETFALPRIPETVVWAYFAGNDLADSREFAEMLSEGRSFAEAVHHGKLILDYSVLFNLALRLFKSTDRLLAAPCHYPQMAATEPPTPVAFYDEFLPVLTRDENTLRASEAFGLTRVSIAEIAGAQLSWESRTILMYIPQKAEIYWRRLTDQAKATIVAALDPQYQAEDYRAIDANFMAQRNLLGELASELEIEFLDLTEGLAAAASEGQAPYFFSDTHWNQLGHNIARNALLELLNQSNLEG